MELAIDVHVSFLLLEQPEDLGVLARGPYKGQRSASIWQWPAMDRVAKLPRVTTLALHQIAVVQTIPSQHACYYLERVICKTSAMWPPDVRQHWELHRAATSATQPAFDERPCYIRSLQDYRNRAVANTYVPVDGGYVTGFFLFSCCYDCYRGARS